MDKCKRLTISVPERELASIDKLKKEKFYMSGIKSKEIEGCVGVVQSGMKELRRSGSSLGWEGEKDVAEK